MTFSLFSSIAPYLNQWNKANNENDKMTSIWGIMLEMNLICCLSTDFVEWLTWGEIVDENVSLGDFVYLEYCMSGSVLCYLA